MNTLEAVIMDAQRLEVMAEGIAFEGDTWVFLVLWNDLATIGWLP